MVFKLAIEYRDEDREIETLECQAYVVEKGVLRIYKPNTYSEILKESVDESTISINEIIGFQAVEISENYENNN